MFRRDEKPPDGYLGEWLMPDPDDDAGEWGARRRRWN